MFQRRGSIQNIFLIAVTGMLVLGTGCAEMKRLRQENAELSKQLKEKEEPAPVITAENKLCVSCHRNHAPALVKEWEHSRHDAGIGPIAKLEILPQGGSKQIQHWQDTKRQKDRRATLRSA